MQTSFHFLPLTIWAKSELLCYWWQLRSHQGPLAACYPWLLPWLALVWWFPHPSQPSTPAGFVTRLKWKDNQQPTPLNTIKTQLKTQISYQSFSTFTTLLKRGLDEKPLFPSGFPTVNISVYNCLEQDQNHFHFPKFTKQSFPKLQKELTQLNSIKNSVQGGSLFPTLS